MSQVKLRGINLVMTPADPNFNVTWTNLWGYWPWSSSLQPQIDLCVANAGVNAFRLIGGMSAVYSGIIDLPTYIAQWEQLVSYCESLGCYVILEGPDIEDMSGNPNATMISWTETLVEAMNSYDNIIAMDLVSEMVGAGDDLSWTDDQILTFAGDLYEAIKPIANFPCSYSHSYTFDNEWVAMLAPYCDIIDFHLYPDVTTDPTTVIPLLETYPLKRLMFSEFGDNQGQPSSERVANAQCVLAMDLLPQCIGSWYWSSVDNEYEAFPAANNGLFEDITSTSPRDDVWEVFNQFPTVPAQPSPTTVTGVYVHRSGALR